MSGCLLTGDAGWRSHRQPRRLGNRGRVDRHELMDTTSRIPPARMARGDFERTLPAATYDITASAYGYLPATVTGVSLPTGGVTQDFVLQAAPSVTPQVSISGDLTATRLTWTHVAPNMTYTVHRAPEPYFTPAPDNQKESLGLPFADTIIYDDPDDLTGSGNQFYAVVGNNAAGAGAPPDRVAVFSFDLQPGG